MILSYLLASLLVLPAMLSKAELATAMPKSGGTYFFIDRTFGPAFGTLGGIANWFSISLKSAFALIGIGEFVTLIYPNITQVHVKLIAIACCILFVLINIRSVRHAGKAQIVMVLGLIAVLLFYGVAGLSHVDMGNFSPLVPNGTVSILGTAGLVFISYGGLTKIASVSEEVRNPGRNIPLGMILSLGVVSGLYALVIFVTTGILDGGALAGSLTPLSDGAGVLFGMPGVIVLSIAAMLSFITTANAGIMSSSRVPMAMSLDGLLPKAFARVGSRFKTPHTSILFTALFMIAAIVLLNLENLVKLASTLMILLFMFVNLSVIIMRESKTPNYQPSFRAPFYPWLQVAGVLSCFFLLVEMGVGTLFIATLFLTGSFVWYWLYARVRVERESALICLIQRIANKDLPCQDLGSELRGIIRARDEIIDDRFDELVRRCLVLDIPEKISVEEVFARISKEMAAELNMDAGKLGEMMLAREDESSTALSPGLAIPHVIVEGSGVFELMLVRSGGGIVFPNVDQPVHAIFALLGSRDERNFHLTALMAIAQITQRKSFFKRWLGARGIDELKDVVLSSKRKRNAS
jgi:basic amino acid/polyamine antiporter, APA family